jgi:glycosyltransferase involved in cell wall biosynthesis
MQIIIVYRPRDDPETAQWLEIEAISHPRWNLIAIDRPGQVAAQNAAIEEARGDILVIFDDDVVPRPDWFGQILGPFVDDHVAAVGGRDVIHGPMGEITQPALSKAGYRSWSGRIVGGHNLVVGPPRDVEVVKGCNWAIRKSALGTLRFDERLLGTGAQMANDGWLCLNLRHAGWRVVLNPNAIVDHYPGVKPDYSYAIWSRVKCYEWTANITAYSSAYLSYHRLYLYVVHQVLIGARSCPGFLFLVHGIIKRPGSLPDMMIGGWGGFFRGLKMAAEFRRFAPGIAASPPKYQGLAPKSIWSTLGVLLKKPSSQTSVK